MSYDIRLTCPVSGETLKLDQPHQMRGGTYVMGGTDDAWLNITYNWAHFHRAFESEEGVRVIYGMSGAESIPILDRAISRLGDDVDPDYWKSTEGNAKRALTQLRALAVLRPDGVWRGD